MMKGHENSFDKQSSKVNALLIIDIQEKIIRPIFNKDSIIKNIKKLINAYQILEENIFISEQNPLKLGVTIPELLPKAEFRKIEKMEFSLAKIEIFLKDIFETFEIIIDNKVPIKKIDIARRKFSVTNFIFK